MIYAIRTLLIHPWRGEVLGTGQSDPHGLGGHTDADYVAIRIPKVEFSHAVLAPSRSLGEICGAMRPHTESKCVPRR